MLGNSRLLFHIFLLVINSDIRGGGGGRESRPLTKFLKAFKFSVCRTCITLMKESTFAERKTKSTHSADNLKSRNHSIFGFRC